MQDNNTFNKKSSELEGLTPEKFEQELNKLEQAAKTDKNIQSIGKNSASVIAEEVVEEK